MLRNLLAAIVIIVGAPTPSLATPGTGEVTPYVPPPALYERPSGHRDPQMEVWDRTPWQGDPVRHSYIRLSIDANFACLVKVEDGLLSFAQQRSLQPPLPLEGYKTPLSEGRVQDALQTSDAWLDFLAHCGLPKPLWSVFPPYEAFQRGNPTEMLRIMSGK